MYRYFVMLLLFTFGVIFLARGQVSDSIHVADYNRKEIQNLTKEDLLELSLEELMILVKKLKVSSIEELYELILNPTVRSASKMKEQSFESPLSVSVITSNEIEDAGPLNIPEALRLSPDLIVRQKTNGNYDVHIRGNDNVPPGKFLFDSENTITLVMIDNRPVYNKFQGGTFWESLPIGLQDVEKIEVVAGPSTALYGPNAVSGVINILTKEPGAEKLRVNADLQYGNAGVRNAEVSLNRNLTDQFAVRLSANHQYRERFQKDYLYFQNYEYYPPDSLPGLVDKSKERYPEPELALNNYGLNAALRFSNDKNTDLNISVGHQESVIQTIYLDINNLSLTRRNSNTSYLDFRGNVHNFKAQVSYDFGTQNNAVGFYGFKFDVANFQSKLEYDFKKGIIQLSPGISFSKTLFNDEPYLDKADPDDGLFNGEVELRNMAYFLRGELRPAANLRIIGALRMEDYNLPEEEYWTYQMIASYTISDKSNLRVAYSRANRGPFMFDYHVDHYSEEVNSQGFTKIERFRPNKQLDLVTMDMLEFGFRYRLRDNLMTDFSFFYNKAQNFSSYFTSTDTTGQTIISNSSTKNIDLKSYQLGSTARINYVLSKNLHVRLFATGQLTVLENLNLDYSVEDEDFDIVSVNSDFIHKSTPSVFGGLVINYQPAEKWNLNTNFYRYGKQGFFSIDGITKLDSKTILSVKTSYKFYKDNKVFFNARNFIDNSSYEFPFADKTSGQYLVGLNLNF